MMDTDFCGVYSVGESLFQDKTLKRDIRPGSRDYRSGVFRIIQN